MAIFLLVLRFLDDFTGPNHGEGHCRADPSSEAAARPLRHLEAPRGLLLPHQVSQPPATCTCAYDLGSGSAWIRINLSCWIRI
jgi:hypothetical protein